MPSRPKNFQLQNRSKIFRRYGRKFDRRRTKKARLHGSVVTELGGSILDFLTLCSAWQMVKALKKRNIQPT